MKNLILIPLLFLSFISFSQKKEKKVYELAPQEFLKNVKFDGVYDLDYLDSNDLIIISFRVVAGGARLYSSYHVTFDNINNTYKTEQIDEKFPNANSIVDFDYFKLENKICRVTRKDKKGSYNLLYKVFENNKFSETEIQFYNFTIEEGSYADFRTFSKKNNQYKCIYSIYSKKQNKLKEIRFLNFDEKLNFINASNIKPEIEIDFENNFEFGETSGYNYLSFNLKNKDNEITESIIQFLNKNNESNVISFHVPPAKVKQGGFTSFNIFEISNKLYFIRLNRSNEPIEYKFEIFELNVENNEVEKLYDYKINSSDLRTDYKSDLDVEKVYLKWDFKLFDVKEDKDKNAYLTFVTTRNPQPQYSGGTVNSSLLIVKINSGDIEWVTFIKRGSYLIINDSDLNISFDEKNENLSITTKQVDKYFVNGKFDKNVSEPTLYDYILVQYDIDTKTGEKTSKVITR